MIIDKLENIHLYKNIPVLVVDFVKSLDKNVPLGKQILSDEIYVNIEQYSTKSIEEAKFEAHDKYIDIQILLSGQESIYLADRMNLDIKIPYSPEKDIVFYSDLISAYPKIDLDGSNFVMIFPHEAHAPQVSVNNNHEKVLKVVVKIKIAE